MPEPKTEKIQSILKTLPVTKLEGLKMLFWEELNYDHENQPLSHSDWNENTYDLFSEPPVLFASAGSDNTFHIIYGHLQDEKMSVGAERALINELIKGHPHALFIFSNLSQNHWHFVNAIFEKDEKAQKRRVLRRISISPEDRLRTASERIAQLDVVLAGKDLFGTDPFKLQKVHEDAFNVEAVTEEFFEDYKVIFSLLKNDLTLQTKDKEWAHDFALQFMNRLMFLYYIERKRWLGSDPDFLHNYWRAYIRVDGQKDTFVKDWLGILFFEAFNKMFSAGRSDVAYIPVDFRNALQLAPWLNGGLFTKNKLDSEHTFLIKDSLISKIFDFLDQYNFTISEDTPLDQEVAVDPEMIGKVYESLVNVSAEADEQGDAGIFYTPRIEIDLMCRLTLVDWLANNLPEIKKNVLYEFVFAFTTEDKNIADEQLIHLNLWPTMDRLLNGVTVLDPACGSGSFLVGMLIILDDLLARCSKALGRQETSYERRKHIAGSSLYGVDIMEWAVHVAELRLWLQLVIDTDLDENELRLRPLLPNLSFKLRRGDSLMQEIGGMNLGLRRAGGQLRRELSGKINTLKAEKLKYFNNEEDKKYKNKEQVEQAEHLLFQEIIEDELLSKIKTRDELNLALAPVTNLFGEIQDTQIKLESIAKRHDLELVEEAISKLRPALDILKNNKTIPFVWDVSFVEIFEGEKEGFDIVVGNPPYVRQERIHDPALAQELVTTENKKEYKEKLAHAVYSTWPNTFTYNPARASVGWALNKKSDYYIYFYFIGLSLLNDKGSFCFITSNSWLDVGYGSDLQRFLLTRGKVKLILDNQVKRSFKNADVNTIIALLAPPSDVKNDHKESLAHDARFVMFKVPFENGLSAVLWEEVEEEKERKTTTETRIVVKTQKELVETGLDPESGVYEGDKWGGKYLRAPDIYWTIMEKCKDKLVRLGDIADVRFGIKTGANEFFYLDDEKISHWGIEDEFLVPVIKSSRECKGIKIVKHSLETKLFYCQKTKNELKNTQALKYIEWGESENFHNRPSCRNRSKWWSIGHREIPPIVNPCSIAEFSRTFLNDDVLCDKRLYEIYPNDKEQTFSILHSLNSTMTTLFLELGSRTGLGEGLIDLAVYELANCPVFIFSDRLTSTEQINKLAQRSILAIENELKLDDRLFFDWLLFSEMGLTKVEVNQLYESVSQMVRQRLNRVNN